MLASEHYGRKHFPLREFIAAQAEKPNRPDEFILPLRLDDAPLPGLDPDVVHIDLREMSVDEVADVLLAKLRGISISEMEMQNRWVATFGLTIEDLLENWSLPEEIDRYYPALCDWLEHDLERRLSGAGLGELDQSEASSRDGECLSVRFAFTLHGDPASLDFGELDWWELLELVPFSSVYSE